MPDTLMFKQLFCTALAVALLAATPRVYTTRYDVRRFHDCNAAAFYAADHPLVGLYRYRFQARFVGTTITHVPSLGYRGSARIMYSLAPGQSTIVLPRWSWPDMSASQRETLGDFADALRNHEIGHVEIALAGIAGRTSTITVLGQSFAQTKAMLQSAGDNQLNSLASEVLRTEKTYDRVTGHGTEQVEGPSYGFRGGENVKFGCR
ncbi:MAG: DUF922 domain-containing protein [Candidatus Eremiobacteraeota bacterium]|nr:DUF922 domain-containing protein [Candidatus Eremiobacteraeota bacterium]